jgi:hypothetical protein
MNDSELKSLLKSWQLPPPGEGTAERALHRALLARHSAPAAAPSSKPKGWLLPWALVSLGVLIIAIFLMLPADKSVPSFAAAPLLDELETLFPADLRGVVVQGEEVQLLLAPGATPRPSDQRILIEWQPGDQTVHILTYSGESICVEGPEGPLCLTPLLTGSGAVLILTESGLLETHASAEWDARRMEG